MAALPYIQLYVADYLADTMHLTAEEHGAYLLLIMNYWQTGKPIPKKRIGAIARLSNDRLTDVIDSLQEFFIEDEAGEYWTHKRIEIDLEKVRSKSKQASEAGKKSAEKRWGKKNTSNGSITDVTKPLKRNCKHTDTDTDTDTDTEENKEANASCPEPEKSDSGPEPDHPVVISEPFCEILLSGGNSSHVVTENDIAEYQDAFPGIDVRQEVRKCQQWNKSSPTRRKTKAGIRRHISAWLGRAQDKSGFAPQGNGAGYKTRSDQNKQACESFIGRMMQRSDYEK